MFASFLAESFDITHVFEPCDGELHSHNFEGVCVFIKQLKEIVNLTHSHPEIFQEKDDPDSETPAVFLNIFHPLVISKINALNNIDIKQALAMCSNPVKVDLYPYVVKYYYQFFYAVKNQNPQEPAYQQELKKRNHHARHTSLASLVSIPIRTDDYRTLNKSCQHFSTLKKEKIVNLNKMFENISATPSSRRGHHKSMALQGFSNNLSQNVLKDNFSDRMANFQNRGEDQEPIKKQKIEQENVELEGLSFEELARKGSTVIHSPESKPEIVKRVIQKLESEDFVFKPNPRKKSAVFLKPVTSLQPKPTQIKEEDEFIFEEMEKVRIT